MSKIMQTRDAVEGLHNLQLARGDMLLVITEETSVAQ